MRGQKQKLKATSLPGPFVAMALGVLFGGIYIHLLWWGKFSVMPTTYEVLCAGGGGFVALVIGVLAMGILARREVRLAQVAAAQEVTAYSQEEITRVAAQVRKEMQQACENELAELRLLHERHLGAIGECVAAANQPELTASITTALGMNIARIQVVLLSELQEAQKIARQLRHRLDEDRDYTRVHIEYYTALEAFVRQTVPKLMDTDFGNQNSVAAEVRRAIAKLVYDIWGHKAGIVEFLRGAKALREIESTK